MHSLQEFVESYLVKDEQLYVKRGFQQVLTCWSELRQQEKIEAIQLRSHNWSDGEIEAFLDKCATDKEIAAPVTAVEFAANVASLKANGNDQIVSEYLENGRINGELRRMCKVLAKDFQARARRAGNRYLNLF